MSSGRIPGSFWEDPDPMDTTETDEDYLPGEAAESESGGESDTMDEELEAEVLEAEEEGEQEEAADGNVRIGIDPRTQQIYMIDSNGNAQPLREDSRWLRAMLGGGLRGGRLFGRRQDEDEDDDDEGNVPAWFRRRESRGNKPYFPIVKEPVPEGVELSMSGEFGQIPASQLYQRRHARTLSNNIADVLRQRACRPGRMPTQAINEPLIPNSIGTEVVRLDANVYCGQYSDDGSFFYTASQDFRIRIYKGDTPHVSSSSKSTKDSDYVHTTSRLNYRGRFTGRDQMSLKLMKSISAHDAYSRWTTTDAALAPNNNSLIYSSISPVVNFVRTRDSSDSTDMGGIETFANDARDHVQLDFSTGSRSSFGIWSIRFSADAREIVAGASQGSIHLYDIEQQRSVLRIRAHGADVNATCFADKESSNVLVSGSDDSLIKVWDRRSLEGERPSGILVGHTEGLTFVAPKGDGRYVVSNGKDQTCKLWDLRKMRSEVEYSGLRPKDCGIPDWDYRDSYYPSPKYKKHPHDGSVMTYTGHTVLQTLIRCHFSPEATTGQRYIYSGSTDGRVHIWGLDGRVVQVLDRRDVQPLYDSEGRLNDPCKAPPATPGPNIKHFGESGATVRDVSWHPLEPTILASSWEGRNSASGSVAMHRFCA